MCHFFGACEAFFFVFVCLWMYVGAWSDEVGGGKEEGMEEEQNTHTHIH